jgi:hypothetical protein
MDVVRRCLTEAKRGAPSDELLWREVEFRLRKSLEPGHVRWLGRQEKLVGPEAAHIAGEAEEMLEWLERRIP